MWKRNVTEQAAFLLPFPVIMILFHNKTILPTCMREYLTIRDIWMYSEDIPFHTPITNTFLLYFLKINFKIWYPC